MRPRTVFVIAALAVLALASVSAFAQQNCDCQQPEQQHPSCGCDANANANANAGDSTTHVTVAPTIHVQNTLPDLKAEEAKAAQHVEEVKKEQKRGNEGVVDVLHNENKITGNDKWKERIKGLTQAMMATRAIRDLSDRAVDAMDRAHQETVDAARAQSEAAYKMKQREEELKRDEQAHKRQVEQDNKEDDRRDQRSRDEHDMKSREQIKQAAIAREGAKTHNSITDAAVDAAKAAHEAATAAAKDAADAQDEADRARRRALNMQAQAQDAHSNFSAAELERMSKMSASERAKFEAMSEIERRREYMAQLRSKRDEAYWSHVEAKNAKKNAAAALEDAQSTVIQEPEHDVEHHNGGELNEEHAQQAVEHAGKTEDLEDRQNEAKGIIHWGGSA